MTPKEKLIESIERIMSTLDEDRIRVIYQFVLHLSK